MRRWLAAALLLAAGAAASAEPPAIPTDSLYQLDLALTAQDGRAAGLDVFRGHPTLVTMFYGSCPHVCPMLIASMRHMERQLPESGRKRLRVLLVSLDPERDTPAALLELAQRHNADLSRWTFARVEDSGVRKLAAALGIRYRRLPDGGYNHSTAVSLLDASGRITRQTSTLSPLDAAFLESLRQAVGAPADAR